MKEPIKIAALVQNAILEETTSGDALDMRPSNYLGFEGAIVRADIGEITGTPDSVKVKIEESDSSTFASGNTVADGGAEVTVEASTAYVFQIQRTKRYIRAVVTVTGGTTPKVTTSIVAVLNNWARPYNLG